VNLLRGFKRPRTLAERYLERGLHALDHKKYDDAIADLTEAIRQMVSIADVVEPRPQTGTAYDELYLRFRKACARRGYE
jgi:hypothetical protein